MLMFGQDVVGSGFNPGMLSGLQLFLDASDSSTITKTYQNLTATGSGTSGTSTITASGTITNLIQAGMVIRIGGTDTYTVASASGTTITTTTALTATYLAGSAMALDRVSQWNDKSGNGNNVTQGTALTQPVYYPNAKNSRSVLTFDGANALTIPSGLWTIPGGDNTIFAAARKTATSATTSRIITIGSGGSSRYWLLYNEPTANQVSFLSRTAPASDVQNSSITDTNYNILTAFRSGTTQSLQVNNGTAATNTNGADASSLTEGAIGANSLGNNNFLIGNIAELIIYNRALSASEIAQVNRYLGFKWGITIS